MPRPILSSPPSHIEKLDSYGWREWLNSVFNRLGDGPFSITGFTVAGLPNATENGTTGSDPFSSIIFVSDETGGAVLAFSDGTNWRRVTDRAIVS